MDTLLFTLGSRLSFCTGGGERCHDVFDGDKLEKQKLASHGKHPLSGAPVHDSSHSYPRSHYTSPESHTTVTASFLSLRAVDNYSQRELLCD